MLYKANVRHNINGNVECFVTVKAYCFSQKLIYSVESCLLNLCGYYPEGVISGSIE